MTSSLVALCFDANDPAGLARFWAGLLDREVVPDRDGAAAVAARDNGAFRLRFLPSRRPKVGPNRIHLDLTSTSVADQQQRVERALALGGHPLDLDLDPDDEHVVLTDPEGNELCVIEPGNGFLAGCGLIGAINCDGSQEVGHFWSAALGWPLVWDENEETAIQSPGGGTKIAWGGPPYAPKNGKARLHFDLVPAAGADQHAEIDRLLSLGATRVDIGQGTGDWAVLADPDGNEFCLLPA